MTSRDALLIFIAIACVWTFWCLTMFVVSQAADRIIDVLERKARANAEDAQATKGTGI